MRSLKLVQCPDDGKKCGFGKLSELLRRLYPESPPISGKPGAFPLLLPAVDVDYSGVLVPRTGTAVGTGLFGINVLPELVVLSEKPLSRRTISLG